MVTGILDGLRWLGLDWDEGPGVGGAHAPYFQSQRLDRYRAAADLLEAAATRTAATARRSGCATSASALNSAERRGSTTARAWPHRRRSPGSKRRAPAAIRFSVPEGHTAFDDAVHGRIEFDTANIEDFVILRSDRHPTYHLSVVVDDVDMGITM